LAASRSKVVSTHPRCAAEPGREGGSSYSEAEEPDEDEEEEDEDEDAAFSPPELEEESLLAPAFSPEDESPAPFLLEPSPEEESEDPVEELSPEPPADLALP